MFYTPEDGHALPHDPLNALVAPRPIAWISTLSPDGVANLAPYSYFNLLAPNPPQVMFSSHDPKTNGQEKDTITNVRNTGVFCVNLVEYSQRFNMQVTARDLPAETDEAALAGLTTVPCETIPCPRLPDAPAALECRLTQLVPLKGHQNTMAVGEVLGIHLREDLLTAGRFDHKKFSALARLGYKDFTRVRDVFTLPLSKD